MNIRELIKKTQNPKPYEGGTADMWTDKHISKQLLSMHLDGRHDIASRTEDKTEKIIEGINKSVDGKKLRILDLGCGPGLYTERLSKLGHDVIGIDFSTTSIEYAKESAEEKGLDIEYICQNYLDMKYENEFDVISLIYCDFGVLSISDRKSLLSNVFRALKKGGVFIFDALNGRAIENITFSKNWEYSDGGFWKATPYIAFSESYHFENEKATLDQHMVIDDDGEYEIYRFWNHYFDKQDIENIFLELGFKQIEVLDIVLDGGSYSDNGVSFYKVSKIEGEKR